MSKLKQLREERAAAFAKAVEILKIENRSAAQTTEHDNIMAAVDTLGQEIARIERSEKLEQEMRAGLETASLTGTPTNETKEAREKRHAAVISDYLKNGLSDMKPEHRAALVSEFRDTVNGQQAGQGAVTNTAGTAGGYFVPAGFMYEVEQATKWFCPMLDGATSRVIETASGQVLPFPTGDDTASTASLLSENTQASEQDVVIGQISLNAWKYTTGIVRVSLELMNDSAFNFESYLAARFAERLGRRYEIDLTTGNGSSKPQGFITGIQAQAGYAPVTAAGSNANDGITGNNGTNSIGSQDLVNLVHSVDPSYRRSAKYVFHDKTLGFLQGLLDKFGRPLWTPSVKEGEPDKINGYAYVIDQAMAQIGAGNASVAFGDWSKFVIRKVKNLEVLRLVERYADYGQIGFVGFARIDSKVISTGATSIPLNLLVQHT